MSHPPPKVKAMKHHNHPQPKTPEQTCKRDVAANTAIVTVLRGLLGARASRAQLDNVAEAGKHLQAEVSFLKCDLTGRLNRTMGEPRRVKYCGISWKYGPGDRKPVAGVPQDGGDAQHPGQDRDGREYLAGHYRVGGGRYKGGTNHKADLQLLCPVCNSRKGTDEMSVLTANLIENWTEKLPMRRVELEVVGNQWAECGLPVSLDEGGGETR